MRSKLIETISDKTWTLKDLGRKLKRFNVIAPIKQNRRKGGGGQQGGAFA